MSAPDSGALFDISGTVANSATWLEDIYFTEDGTGLDISGLDWKMTFRKCAEQSSADLTLSLSGGNLSVVADESGSQRILRINAGVGSLTSFCGDYVCDLASENADGVVQLWGHGTVSFRPNPVSF